MRVSSAQVRPRSLTAGKFPRSAKSFSSPRGTQGNRVPLGLFCRWSDAESGVDHGC